MKNGPKEEECGGAFSFRVLSASGFSLTFLRNEETSKIKWDVFRHPFSSLQIDALVYAAKPYLYL